MERNGTLGGYLDAMYMTAQSFDQFYDFSVPSRITADPRLTYDGSHFTQKAQIPIARTLGSGAITFGLAVHQLNKREYRERFTAAVRAFVVCLERENISRLLACMPKDTPSG